MGNKYTTERKKNRNKNEAILEEYLTENGYSFQIKEYQTKTDYLILKDGLELEFTVHNIDGDRVKAFNNAWGINKEYQELKQMCKER